eukprot:TRINITY_DN64736_c0_g1_i1.p1 TRINITY_DN64736_c0_g1~~TRINITY_DN64736_c0_g1_i1.p1  ORF type:complete len:807 (-),score=129.69 TRINITY_DN64736_c0_g1_i1:205-2625(-)
MVCGCAIGLRVAVSLLVSFTCIHGLNDVRVQPKESERLRLLLAEVVGSGGDVSVVHDSISLQNVPIEAKDQGLLDTSRQQPGGFKDPLIEQMIGKLNAEGDLQAFSTSLFWDSSFVMICFLLFSILRLIFPLVFQGNTDKMSDEVIGAKTRENDDERGAWPPPPGRGILDWIWASLVVRIDDVEVHRGLDTAMMLEFTQLCSKLSAAIGLPMCLVMCPLNFFFGGKGVSNGVDRLSTISMANIETGSWLYWVYAVIVWLVVYVTEMLIFNAQDSFLKRRYRWLKAMPAPRSTTILVENIPDMRSDDGLELCSDEGLRSFFEKMFSPESVAAVHVVRYTQNLSYFKWKLELAKRRHQEAERDGAGSSREVIEKLEEDVARATREFEVERAALNSIKTKGAASGFITFTQRRDAEIALRLQYFSDAEDCVASSPPEASDVRWCDLRANPNVQAARERLGYLCVVGLYLAFTPLVVGVSSVTSLRHLQEISPFVKKLVIAMPRFAVLLEGVLASLALTLFLSFLPTILLLIFHHFLTLKANAWAQLKLQGWYFWFQIVFVLLITAVGSSFVEVAKQVMDRPSALFSLLADTLPSATHFYLNFIVAQWVTHSLNLLRYMNLAKYIMARLAYFDDRQAKEMSEPEDQDYFGIGSRSARWTTNMVIGLVFCSLSPLISVVVCINFLLSRLIYGYLLVYAETTKVDLGGVFFVRKLKHLQHGVIIYIILMAGVLLKGAATDGPAILAGASLLWALRQRYKFDINLQWEKLPFKEIVDDDSFKKREAFASGGYIEADLLEQTDGRVPEQNKGTE